MVEWLKVYLGRKMKRILLAVMMLLVPLVVEAEIQSFKFWIENDNLKGKIITTDNFLAYNIGFDSDNNPETGCSACGYPGIDYEISFAYQGGICDPVVLFCNYSNCSCSSSDPLNEKIEWSFEQNGKVFNFSIPLETIYKDTFKINIFISYLQKIIVPGNMLADDHIIDCLNLDIRCDFDKDYDVDGSDLIIFSNNFGNGGF